MDDGTTIITIIDESHSNSTSARALELRDEVVNADLTIEMSATPVLCEGHYNDKVVVQPNDVIEEGMKKKEFIESFLAGKDITYDNKRLAVWLSEEKVNNENKFVTPNDWEYFEEWFK